MDLITSKNLESGDYHRCQLDLGEHKFLWAFAYGPLADFDKQMAAELRDNPDVAAVIVRAVQQVVEALLYTVTYRSYLVRKYIESVEKETLFLGLDYFMYQKMYRSAAILLWTEKWLSDAPAPLTNEQWVKLKEEKIVKAAILVSKWPTKAALDRAIEQAAKRYSPSSSTPPPVPPAP